MIIIFNQEGWDGVGIRMEWGRERTRLSSGHRSYREGEKEEKKKEKEKGIAVTGWALVNAVMSINLTAGLVASMETGRVGSESLLSDWVWTQFPAPTFFGSK